MLEFLLWLLGRHPDQQLKPIPIPVRRSPYSSR